MGSKKPTDLTRLLEQWSDGDPRALDSLLPMVFDDLHRLARHFFQRESETHTLQPTALVNEVYFRLRGQKQVSFKSRGDFFAFAADVMRHFLVDYARRRNAEKRGGDLLTVSLETGVERLLLDHPAANHIVDVHDAVETLARVDPRQADVVKLRFFLGLQVDEVAELLEISESTVKREWRTAKRWLHRRLSLPLDE